MQQTVESCWCLVRGYLPPLILVFSSKFSTLWWFLCQGKAVGFRLEVMGLEERLVTRAIGLEQIIAQKVLTLSREQQQQVLHFVEFLQLKSPTVEFKHHDGTPMSALEAAGDLVGSVDSGPGDLSTNKEYLKRPLAE